MNGSSIKENKSNFAIFLLCLAFLVDLLTPILITRGRIPSSLRWISQLIVAFLFFWLLLRMLAFNRIPFVFILLLFLSGVGLLNAILRGQGIPETLWGWWLMFQFPIVGLFCYLQPSWPKDFPRIILIACLALLGFEVLVQIYQYLRGTIPGDHLSGTFGRNGTGNLVIFLLLTVSFSLGEWLFSRNWIPLTISIVCGLISSTLGEMKFFLPSLVVLGLVALLIFLLQARQMWKFIPYGIILTTSVFAFFTIYNAVVPVARQIPLEQFFTDPQSLASYMNSATRYGSGPNVYIDIGRNYAIQYGWEQIRSDPLTLLLGIGLGARAESSSLGFVGQGLLQGNLGISTGTSLLVIMQETGILGLTLLAVFFFYVVLSLNRVIQKKPEASANGIRYGLILFTILWPMWLWYNTAWILRVPMLLYWAMLGYVLGIEETSIVADEKKNNEETNQTQPLLSIEEHSLS